MAYTEQVTKHHMVNGETQEVEIHTVTVTLKDGAPIARTKHIEVLPPGAVLKGRDEATVKLATAAWTPEAVAAWDEKFQAQVAASREMRAAELADLELQAAQIQEKRAEIDASREAAATL